MKAATYGTVAIVFLAMSAGSGGAQNAGNAAQAGPQQVRNFKQLIARSIKILCVAVKNPQFIFREQA